MRTWIAVGVVCLALGMASVVSAQEQDREPEQEQERDESAPASVELSLSISPTFLLTLPQIGSGLGVLAEPVLDVGFALDRRLLLVLGVMASITGTPSGGSVYLGVPASLLWYLEEPRVGRVMPMLRVGVMVGYDEYGGNESVHVGALARGGITWLADRHIGIRAEIGLRGSALLNDVYVSGSLGLDALVGVVLRV